jgi:glutaredoxin
MEESRMDATATQRPEISVFWKPGCSSCLKAKEFLEEQGLPFESMNVLASQPAMDEIVKAGFRSVPVVRRGDKYMYAQNLDEVAELLGVSRSHKRLPQGELLDRWDQILGYGKRIIGSFTEEQLKRRAIADRDRTIRLLSLHVYQIVDAFMMSVYDGLVDIIPTINDERLDIATRDDLSRYTDDIIAKYHAFRQSHRDQLPDSIVTYYGEQPSGLVLERGCWHSGQHVRQLDVIAAGMGAEFQVPPEVWQGLPMPKRLWA